MRAVLVSCGFDITLYLRDKEIGQRQKPIESHLIGEKGVRVVLHVRNTVPWRGMLEEPGFHIRGIPRNSRIKQYDIYLSAYPHRE